MLLNEVLYETKEGSKVVSDFSNKTTPVKRTATMQFKGHRERGLETRLTMFNDRTCIC